VAGDARVRWERVERAAKREQHSGAKAQQATRVNCGSAGGAAAANGSLRVGNREALSIAQSNRSRSRSSRRSSSSTSSKRTHARRPCPLPSSSTFSRWSPWSRAKAAARAASCVAAKWLLLTWGKRLMGGG